MSEYIPVSTYEVMTGLGAEAMNQVSGTNPAYALSDFYAMYPQFAPTGVSPNEVYVVPLAVMTMYLNLANATVKHARWLDAWEVGMGMFIAHFLTLFLQGTASAGSPAATVIAAGQARGLTTSRSAGDVSASTDYNLVGQDLDGWAAWKLTLYGTQYATLAKTIGMGGMYIW